VGGSIAAIVLWSRRDFGEIPDPRQTLRIVICSVTALTLGFEIILASFFLSILGLRVRRLDPGKTP
jgi:hypothetical protein